MNQQDRTAESYEPLGHHILPIHMNQQHMNQYCMSLLYQVQAVLVTVILCSQFYLFFYQLFWTSRALGPTNVFHNVTVRTLVLDQLGVGPVVRFLLTNVINLLTQNWTTRLWTRRLLKIGPLVSGPDVRHPYKVLQNHIRSI